MQKPDIKAKALSLELLCLQHIIFTTTRFSHTGNGLTPLNIRLTPLLWFPVCVLTMLNDDY